MNLFYSIPWIYNKIITIQLFDNTSYICISIKINCIYWFCYIDVYCFVWYSAKRTTIIDDQTDYYSMNSGWLSSKQRDQLQKKEEERQEKKHGSRKAKKITIDFAGL